MRPLGRTRLRRRSLKQLYTTDKELAAHSKLVVWV